MRENQVKKNREIYKIDPKELKKITDRFVVLQGCYAAGR